MTNNKSSEASTGGLGVVSILTIVFVVLKLTHLINWSWWWVLSPLWISLGLAVVLIIIAIIITAIVASIKG